MASQTLRGVRVLDFSSYFAGPYAATLLGDLGADVLKIESPDGDTMRHYPTTLPGGESRAFIGANRNKRSLVVDLKRPGAAALCHRLVAGADVVIQNFRPGVARRLALDYDTLVGVNPRLVFCGLTGYGDDGPLADRPGFDQVLQCVTGIAKAQAWPSPAPQVVWGSLVDFYTASLIAMGVSAALYDRQRTGAPQRIDASLLASALALQSGRLVWADGEPRDVQRDLRVGSLAGIHPTREGWLYLQAQTQPFWEALCELTGLAHLARDPRYDDMRKRKEREDELVPALRAALATRTALQWEALFGARVPCAAVRDLGDVFEHPQVLAQGLIAEHEHPTLGHYRAVTQPLRINGRAATQPDRRAPLLGEHTDEVLHDAGLDEAEVAALRSAGVIT